jgi:ParB-like chromosome segregation protein Spo0J
MSRNNQEPALTVQEQLNEILVLLRNQGAEISETKKMLADSQVKVTKLENRVTVLETEVKKLKEAANDRDQADKGRTVRLFGVPITEEETASDGGKSFQAKLYDRILKPCLTSAKTNGDLQSIPQFTTAIEKIFRAGKSSNPDRPAPVIIKFTSEIYRTAVLRHKKNSLPAPSAQEKAAGFRRFMIVEDLTPANYKMLKQLQGREEVARVWSIEGRLRFTLVNNDKVFRVKSVYDPVESVIFVS